MTTHLEIGRGIYSIPEASKLLGLPVDKVRRCILSYWDKRLSNELHKYSWRISGTQAIDFFTLIELFIYYQLNEAGVNTRLVLQAHKELSNMYNTKFPFASKDILNGICTDGKRIYFELDGNFIELNGTKQFNFEFVQLFFKNLEFDDKDMVSRLWPMGKDKEIIVDPKRQFGHPVIHKTNIQPETIFNLYQGGDSVDFIADIFEIEKNTVNDAIAFCKQVA